MSATMGPAPEERRKHGARWSKTAWLTLAALFLAGAGLRVLSLRLPPAAAAGAPHEVSRWRPTIALPYLEIDERIYIALVEQLDAGRGYTLQGHPIMDEPWIDRAQYDHPLFYHPPGGIALFWLAHGLAGDEGFALVQVASFAVFFGSLMLLGWAVLTEGPAAAAAGRATELGAGGLSAALGSLAVLAACTPIMAHVAGRLWLDGPLLAFSTAGAAVFLLSTRARSTALACVAGVLLGYASLIKVTALLVLPGVAALAWAIAPRPEYRELLRRGMLMLAIAAAVQLPWELWQWAVVGSPFPGWAGRPSESLVQSNPYVHYVTVVRSPWTYTVLLPRVIWTLVPALVLLAALRRNTGIARRGAALLLWIVVVVGAHVALGATGYAKLLRLVILVTPATAVLFALTVGGAAGQLSRGQPGRRLAWIALLLLALTGLGGEVAQGLKTSLLDNRGSDLIVPLTGLPR